MRVDGPSTSVVGFSNYTQKLAADAVNPDMVASSQSTVSSDKARYSVESAATDRSLDRRAEFSSDVAEVRSESIEYARQSEDASRAAEQVRSDFSGGSYQKGSIIDTVA